MTNMTGWLEESSFSNWISDLCMQNQAWSDGVAQRDFSNDALIYQD